MDETTLSGPGSGGGLPGRRVALRAVECVLLFGLIPWLVDLKAHRHFLIPFLVVCAGVVFVYLLKSKEFDRRKLLNFEGLRKELPRIVVTWVIGVVVMVGAVWWLSGREGTREEVALFGFPRENTGLWLLILFLYPLFSVYPQELILRAFFFHRYRHVFTRPWVMIVANGLVFAWAHVMFRNVPAVVLCVPAGLLFAYTYWRSKSTLASGLEHAAFGDAMWTIGLGVYFYGGAVE